MAAGLGFKDFVTGEVLTAADVDGYLMQGVWVFADAAARTAAVTSPQEGNMSFLKDTNSTEYYSGSAWVAVAGGGVPTSLEFTAGKNKIINGDFGVNQRNFTSTTTDATFGFDRFPLLYSGGTCTYSAQTFTLGAAPVAGYEGKNFARLVSTSQTTAGHFCATSQKIEDVRTFAGQTVTYSFWAKASTGTPNIGVAMQQNFGSGGSPSSEVITSPAVQAITSSWARYSFTVNVPSISGKTIGTTANTSYLGAWIFTSAGTTISGLGYPAVGLQNVTIDIWGVQLEAGSTATSFQTATGTIQGELAACQRYYVRWGGGSVFEFIGIGTGETSTVATINVNMPVQMRIVPTSLDYSTLSIYDGNSTITSVVATIQSSYAGTKIMGIAATVASGVTLNRPYRLITNNSTSGFLGLSAEL
jgi:hypothetical protein